MAVDESLRSGNKWDRFIYWCARFFEEPSFDGDERAFKIPVTNQLVAAREALRKGDGQWIQGVHAAIHFREGNVHNNLTNWRQTQPLEEWFNAEPDDSALALRHLWNEDLPVPERFNRFAAIPVAHRVKAPIS